MDGGRGSKFGDPLPDFRLPVFQKILLHSMLYESSWFTDEPSWEWAAQPPEGSWVGLVLVPSNSGSIILGADSLL